MKKSAPYPLWVYHETLEPKIIQSNELDTYLKDDWAESPAKFCKIASFGIDPEDTARVQALGETIDGVVDSLNGQINLDKMNKKELIYYADKHLNLELDPSFTKLKILQQIDSKLESGGACDNST